MLGQNNCTTGMPTKTFGSFSTTKKYARQVYEGHFETFYCGCTFTAKGTSGGTIDLDSCGYIPRKSEYRASRLEWEHVMPAATIGANRDCWTVKLENCEKPGRECCDDVDDLYHKAANDLHNLVPSIGEANGDRSNYPYGIIDGEPREYGRCDFEIERGENARAEPAEHIRGDVARIWLYMHQTYNISIPNEQLHMFKEWHNSDSISDWEIERDHRICEIQGNTNPYTHTTTNICLPGTDSECVDI